MGNELENIENKLLFEKYISYYEHYKKKYGDSVIILMQVGAFYETYSTHEEGPDLPKISRVIQCELTRRNKKIQEISRKNFQVVGFQMNSLENKKKILIENGYIVVQIDQITEPPNVKREVVCIDSKGTYIDAVESDNSNNVLSIYCINEKQRDGTYLMSCGLAVGDFSTGKLCTENSQSTKTDTLKALNDTFRFINTHNPKEIIFFYDQLKGAKSLNEIVGYLELDKYVYHILPKIDKEYKNITYQNAFLQRVFKINSLSKLSPIEHLDLERKPECVLSLMILIDYAYEHNKQIIEKLYKPEVKKDISNLILENNALYELNVFDRSNNNDYGVFHTKYKSLFDVVDNTHTPVGKRFLKSALSNPIIDIGEIQDRYTAIDYMIKDKNYLNYESLLDGISDIERLQRQIFLAKIHPFCFARLINSYSSIQKILTCVVDVECLKKYLPPAETIGLLDEFLKHCNETYNVSELSKYSISEMEGSIFNKGIIEDIDELNTEIQENLNFINNLCEVLSQYIGVKPKRKKNGEFESLIKLESNTKGYYLSLTRKRAGVLQSKLQTIECIQVTDKYSLAISDLIFSDKSKVTDKSGNLTSNVKIMLPKMDEISKKLLVLQTKMSSIVKDKYIELLRGYSEKYFGFLDAVSAFVSILDFFVSGAKTAIKYNYCKPTIINNERGFIDCKKLRHPIVERINDEVEYVAHDISLSSSGVDGMLLFGLNSAGKSTLMKATGLSIILAQAGLYVPAQEYVYSPYQYLFARITGNDNIFKGLSSYVLEMTELNAIISNCSHKTLVIGDEICRGTEQNSGNAIVAATIITLAEHCISFMFATHLHAVPKMKRIQELKNVKSYHLTASYDDKKDVIIYDRILKEGQGSEIYGIMVAGYVIKNVNFMNLARKILNENENEKVVPVKKSKYNKKLFMVECAICGLSRKQEDYHGYLDTHHIINQKDCKNGFVAIDEKQHTPMNNLSNLVVLCKECHYLVHNGGLEIYGYKDTSAGKILDFKKLN